MYFTFRKRYSWFDTSVDLIDLTQWNFHHLADFHIWLIHLKAAWVLFLKPNLPETKLSPYVKQEKKFRRINVLIKKIYPVTSNFSHLKDNVMSQT